MNNLIVTKSNKIIEASYKLNLNEQRILLTCISQQNSLDRLKKEDEFFISAMDYSETFNLELKNVYNELKEAADNLFDRHLWIKNPKTGNPIKTRWISSIEYKEAGVAVHFASKIIPYLSELSAEFTSYRLSNVSKLTSIYAIRLYEMLIQWKKIQKVTFDLKNFREALGIQKNEYKRMFDFKRKVLNLAIDQINAHTNINCIVKEIKTGRSITALEFRFGEDCPTQLELEQAIAEAPFMH